MTPLKLNLGCGIKAPKGWENLDSSYRVWVDRIPVLPALGYRRRFPSNVKRFDLRKGLPYPDRSATFIYSSHMIEHLPLSAAQALLVECARVLAPEGRLRILTPDLRLLAQDYLARLAKKECQPDAADHFMGWLGVTAGPRTPFWAVKNLHQWLYDEFSLARHVGESGLRVVRSEIDWISDFPDLDALEPADLRRGSVCLEANLLPTRPNC